MAADEHEGLKAKANEVARQLYGVSFEDLRKATSNPAVEGWITKIVVAAYRKSGGQDVEMAIAEEGAAEIVKLEARIADLEAKLRALGVENP